MIRDGAITHDQFENPILTYEFSSYPFNAIVIAALTTFLAYQITALTFNCFLGFKKPGRANASDLQILLLTAESSILAVASAVFRSDKLDRITYRGAIPTDATIYRRQTSVRKRNVFKLFILLLSAPLYNLISIFLVLERDQNISFSRAKVSGMSVSIPPDLEPINTQLALTVGCQSIPVVAEGDDKQILAAFSKCIKVRFPLQNPTDRVELATGQSLHIRLTVKTNGEISIDFRTMQEGNDKPISVQGLDVYVDLSVSGEAYRVKPNVTRTLAEVLISDGQLKSNRNCTDPQPFSTPAPVVFTEEEGTTLVVTGLVSCKTMNYSTINQILPAMGETISLVEDSNFMVGRQKQTEFNAVEFEPYTNGAALPFLRKRKRNLSLTMLFFLVVGATFLRIVSSLVTHNDVDEGIESVLNKRLGIHPCQSMLQSNTVITYNHRSQSGNQGSFGLERRDMYEVDNFAQRSIIGFERTRGIAPPANRPGKTAPVDDGMDTML